MEIKIAFYDFKPYDAEFFDRVNKKFGYSISYFRERLSPDTAVLSSGHRAVCAFVNDNIDSRVIDRLSSVGVELIALRSAGYNNVDLKAAFRKIHVLRVPEYSPHAVAEHAVALMLSLNRKTHKSYYRTRDHNFSITGLMGFDMNSRTAGIIGTGKIGKIAARILGGFGMKVLLYDPFPDKEFASNTGFRYRSLESLYSESDIISLHCPLNPDTYRIIDSGAIDKMKPGVMIINTGRGKLIDTAALIEGLNSGKVGSAGLDVYEEESEYFFEDFSEEIISDETLLKLLNYPNVLVTSHQGFFTREAMGNIANTTLNNIKGYFEESNLENEICYRCESEPCRRGHEGGCFAK